MEPLGKFELSPRHPLFNQEALSKYFSELHNVNWLGNKPKIQLKTVWQHGIKVEYLNEGQQIRSQKIHDLDEAN